MVIGVFLFGIFLLDLPSVLAISFVSPTPANETSFLTLDSIYANLSSTDVSGQHYSFVDFNDDLLLWWRMDDIDGSGNIIDLSSYNKTGVVNGSVNSNGFFGDGNYFDGANDFINTGHNTNNLHLDVTGNITISLWFQRNETSTGTYEGLAGRNFISTVEYVQYYVAIDSENKVKFSISNGTTMDILLTASTITDNNWHHVVSTWNGTHQLIYLDGVLDNGAVRND